MLSELETFGYQPKVDYFYAGCATIQGLKLVKQFNGWLVGMIQEYKVYELNNFRRVFIQGGK
jgi:hypothetical protein